jgi:hypothetical protein
MDLTDIYKVFQFMTADYSFFAAAHRTFAKLDHILGHKTNLNNNKKLKQSPVS